MEGTKINWHDDRKWSPDRGAESGIGLARERQSVHGDEETVRKFAFGK